MHLMRRPTVAPDRRTPPTSNTLNRSIDGGRGGDPQLNTTFPRRRYTHKSPGVAGTRTPPGGGRQPTATPGRDPASATRDKLHATATP